MGEESVTLERERALIYLGHLANGQTLTLGTSKLGRQRALEARQQTKRNLPGTV